MSKFTNSFQQFMGAVVALAAIASGPTMAGGLTPGNFLVSSTDYQFTTLVREYTTSGSLVQTFSVPAHPSPNSFIRGIAADTTGKVQIYGATFSPYLTPLDPTGSGSYTSHTFSGW